MKPVHLISLGHQRWKSEGTKGGAGMGEMGKDEWKEM
jgi:hypothetical protein